MLKDWAPLIAAAVAAVAALVGYVVTATNARRDRKSREFSDALEAVIDYMFIPGMIVSRRMEFEGGEEPGVTDKEAAARADITRSIVEAQTKMLASLSWLQVDSPSVARQYKPLVDEALKLGPSAFSTAWERSPPEPQIGPSQYDYPAELDQQWIECSKAMWRAVHRFKRYWGTRPEPSSPFGTRTEANEQRR